MIENLWSGIARCSKGEAFSTFGIDWTSQAEVSHFGFRIDIKEDVSGLNITMKDAALVRVRDTSRNLADQVDGDSGINCLFMNGIKEGLSLNVFHDDEEHAIDVSKVVNPN